VNLANPPAVLSPQEAERLRELENIIQEGFESFLKVGIAFAEVKFLRLHRATHHTFEDYCRDRWALSLSRCNQILNTCKVFDNITKTCPQDAALLVDAGEHGLRPLSRLEPELQAASWELIRAIEERPRGTTIEKVVTTIRNAIAGGWQELAPGHELPSARNGNSSERRPRTLQRESGPLGAFSRWGTRLNSWDPKSIALGDDKYTLERHLEVATQIQNFCAELIGAIKEQLATRTI
jgi:hypothetical protein